MRASEKLREENQAKNRVLLAELELENAVDTLGVPKPKPAVKAKPVQPRKPKRKLEEDAPTPRRASSRLKRVLAPANETPEERRKREVGRHMSSGGRLTLRRLKRKSNAGRRRSNDWPPRSRRVLRRYGSMGARG